MQGHLLSLSFRCSPTPFIIAPWACKAVSQSSVMSYSEQYILLCDVPKGIVPINTSTWRYKLHCDAETLQRGARRTLPPTGTACAGPWHLSAVPPLLAFHMDLPITTTTHSKKHQQ